MNSKHYEDSEDRKEAAAPSEEPVADTTKIDEAIDRMLDASAAVAHAEGIYSAGARRELDEAIAAVKALASPTPVASVAVSELQRAAKALLDNLWVGIVDGRRSHEENWREFERRCPGVKWLHEALAASIIPAAKGAVGAPISSLMRDNGEPEWKQINALFLRNGINTFPIRLRDELSTMLAWARYGEAAALSAGTATPKQEGAVTRNDEAGFVEFINSDVPYIVREIDGHVAILIDLETRNVIGYRVYDPAPTNARDEIPTEETSK